MVWLLLASLAWAHRPHAVVSALVVAPEFQVNGRAWLVFAPDDATVLLRTDDFGAHWSVQGGALQADRIVDLAELRGVLYALGADGTVWVSPDEAATWVPYEPTGYAGSSLAAGTAGLAIATDSGVWVGEPTGGMTQALAGVAVTEVAWAADAETLLARTADGGVARSEDGGASFTTLDGLDGTATAIGEVNGAVFVGTTESAWRWEAGVWTACGALPDRDGLFPGRVTEIATRPDGRVYLTTATDAYFYSADACATWSFVATDLDATYGGIGGVVDHDQTYTALVVGDTHQIVAGFDGVAFSADAGATWGRPPIVPVDRVRGLAFPSDFPASPRLFLGTYGGGVGFTDDGGRTWRGSSAGLAGPYNFSLLVDPDYAANRTVWWAGGEPDPAAVSRDDGETWASVPLGVGAAVNVSAVENVRYVTVIDPSGAGRLYRSPNGEAWEHMVALTEALAGAAPAVVAARTTDAGGRLYVASDNPAKLLVSEDDGASWVTLAAWDADSVVGLALWNARVFVATEESGLQRSDDDGATWTSELEPVASPRAFSAADDGTFFVAGGDGQVFRSRDGGDRWELAGEPVLATPKTFAAATDFAANPIVFLGTAQGAWWSDDAGDTWAMLPRFQRMAVTGTRLSCEGPCAPWDDGGGGLADAVDLTELDVVRFTFEGTSLRVVSDAILGAPYWVVEVDGVAVPTDPAAEWLVDGLPADWHDVTLRVAGGNARLFAVEAIGPGVPLPGSEPTDTGDTGDTGDTAPPVDTGDTADADLPADTHDTLDSPVDTGGAPRPPPEDPDRCGCDTSPAPATLALVALTALLPGLRRRAPGAG